MSSMLDDTTVQMLQLHWEDGWNGGDVEMIIEPFAASVVFSSPGIAMLTGDPARTTIEGKAAVRSYIEDALRRTSKVRYRLQATYVGTDSIVIVYGSAPDTALHDSLRGRVRRLFLCGSAWVPRQIAEATQHGMRVGMEV